MNAVFRNLRFFSHFQKKQPFLWTFKTRSSTTFPLGFFGGLKYQPLFQRSFSLLNLNNSLSSLLKPKKTKHWNISTRSFLQKNFFSIHKDLLLMNQSSSNELDETLIEDYIGTLGKEKETVQTLNEKMMLAAIHQKFVYFNIFFEHYIHLKFQINIDTINAMMELASRMERLDQVERIFQFAEKHNISPNEATFNSAIKACISSSNIVLAHSFFERMKSLEISPSEKTYQELMLLYGLNHDPERAVRMIPMMKTHGIYPSQSTYLTLIDIFLANRQPLRAFEIINGLDLLEFEKLESPLNLLIHLFESAIYLDDSKAVSLIFKALRSFSKYSLDEGTILAGLQVAARNGDIDCAELLWDYLIQQLKIKPSAETYSSIIYCFIAAGDIRNSLLFAQEKINQGYPLSTAVFRALADFFSSSIDNLDTGYYILDELYKSGKPVDKELLDTLLLACAQCGEVDRAFATFNEYPNFNLKPSLETYNYLLTVCAHRWQLESSYLLFDEMEKAGIQPNIESYIQLLRSACRGAKLLDAKDVLDKMNRNRMRIPDRVYALVIRACIQFHKHYEMAESLLNEIKTEKNRATLSKELKMDRIKHSFEK